MVKIYFVRNLLEHFTVHNFGTIIYNKYSKVASSNTSRLEAHAGFFTLLMKDIFGPDVLRPYDKKLIFQLVTHIRIRDNRL